MPKLLGFNPALTTRRAFTLIELMVTLSIAAILASYALPDLAGKLAKARRLTAESTREQASAGLDALTGKERELYSKLNAAYVTTFGFPFIIAVRGKAKEEILAEFEARIGNSRGVELDTAGQLRGEVGEQLRTFDPDVEQFGDHCQRHRVADVGEHVEGLPVVEVLEHRVDDCGDPRA